MSEQMNDEWKGLRLRINSIQDDFLSFNSMYDYGISDFCPSNKSPFVPVIKLYCTDEAHDRKCILLLHNVYPYFYAAVPSGCRYERLRSEILSVGCLLDRMLGAGSVQKIIACKGTSLYGYWEEGAQVFLRISLFNPKHIKKAADLLVKMRKSTVFEVHVPFLLQVMIDFDLYGMDHVLINEHVVDKFCSSLLHIWPQCIENRVRLMHKAASLRRSQHKGQLCGIFLDSLTEFLSNCTDRSYLFSPTKCTPFPSPSKNDAPHSLLNGFGWEEQFFELKDLLQKKSQTPTSANCIDWPLPTAFECVELGFSPLPPVAIISKNLTESTLSPVDQNAFMFSPVEIEQVERDENIPNVIVSYEILSQQEQIDAQVLDDVLPRLYNNDDDSEPDADDFNTVMNTLDGIYEPSSPENVFNSSINSPSRPDWDIYPELALDGPCSFNETATLITPLNNPPRLKELKTCPKIIPEVLLTPNRIQASRQETAGFSSYDSLYNVCIFSMELFATGNANQLSDSERDPIFFIAYGIFQKGVITCGVIKICDGIRSKFPGNFHVQEANTEPELIEMFLRVFHDANPDILIGYEVHKASWGYLLSRIEQRYSDMFGNDCLSRDACWKQFTTPIESPDEFNSWDYQKTCSLSIPGRHILNVWRMMRREYDFSLYSFEYVYFNLFGKKMPRISLDRLRWFYSESVTQHRTIYYVLQRVQGNFRFILDTQILLKSVEFCKFFGIDFCHVFSRGSQFKVESLMIRMAKIESFLAYSPTKFQVANMAASESIPMVMEPENKYYTSPVVVLDFQSLYPSLMIAYNYCFSTCLGKLHKEPIDDNGCREHKHRKDLTDTQKILGAGHRMPNINIPDSHLSLAPNGAVFVKKEFREGLLPRMLLEILQARIQIKKMMKTKAMSVERDKLEAFQLGLKLIANVTFGYTSASYSGRMPMVEVADAIVESGRMTLQNSIQYINQHPGWKARVVYGDTDSLFVLLEGATRERAFRIGQEIAAEISRLNPKPVTLRFEKVYHPCILMAKKRYVGWKWEEAGEQAVPIFDAKGIETVRRDSCPLVAKIMEKFLTILFSNKNNVTLGKNYLFKVWTRMKNHYYPISDYIFANEVKDVANKSASLSGLVARDALTKDPANKPEYGERVTYLVVLGVGKKSRLLDMVISPNDYSPDRHEICYDYYIKKQLIPVVSRCLPQDKFNLLEWYNECVHDLSTPLYAFKILSRIDSYFARAKCKTCNSAVVGNLTNNTNSTDPLSTRRLAGFCYECSEGRNSWKSLWYLKNIEENANYYQKVCAECCNVTSVEEIPCIETECRIYWRRLQAERERGLLDG